MLPSYFLSMAKKDNFNEHKFFKCFYEKNINFKVDFILSFLRWRQFSSRICKTFKNIKKNNLITQNYSLIKIFTLIQ